MRIKLTLMCLLLALLIVMPLAAQSPEFAPELPANLTITFADDFEAGGLAASWHVWDHFPAIVEGRMMMHAWKSWSDAVVRPGIGNAEGIVQLFRYEPGPMEFFFDYAGFEEPAYRQVRLGTTGNHHWNVYTSSGVKGVQTRNYGSVELTPGVWYYALIVLGRQGEFYFQIWEPNHADELLLNLQIAPAGDGWANREWWFGNKIYDGTLEVDWFAEVEYEGIYQLPCTARGIGGVNLRSGPGTGFDRSGRLDSDVNMRVLAQTVGPDSFIWWRLPGDQWIRSDVARQAGDCADLPVVSS